jgi:DNA-binding transcriptional LysR family regulator
MLCRHDHRGPPPALLPAHRAGGNITRAAALLHITQPALSRTLRQLETHLGVQLVDRSTHHLELTTAGQHFAARAATAVATFDETTDPARLGTWPLRLGHSWSALGRHTPTLLRRWGRAHPDIPLELLRFDDRTAGLADGRSDVALVRGSAPRGFAGAHLFDERRLAAVPAGGELASRASLTLADLARHPVGLSPTAGSTTVSLWPAGAQPREIVTVANTDDWLAAIAADRAVGVTAESTAQMHGHPGVAFVPLADAPDLPVMLIWADPPSHPAVPLLLALVRQVVADEPGGQQTAGEPTAGEPADQPVEIASRS